MCAGCLPGRLGRCENQGSAVGGVVVGVPSAGTVVGGPSVGVELELEDSTGTNLDLNLEPNLELNPEPNPEPPNLEPPSLMSDR